MKSHPPSPTPPKDRCSRWFPSWLGLVLLGATLTLRGETGLQPMQEITPQVIPLSEWANSGVTPAYEPWKVIWQVRNAANEVVGSVTSQLDLTKLLPTGATPRQVNDALPVSPHLPSDSYSLWLVIVDPTGYRPPLIPAIRGVRADGGFKVCLLEVSKRQEQKSER